VRNPAIYRGDETLSAFIDFFEIDQNLIKGATTASKYKEEESYARCNGKLSSYAR
jgi:hypothetical protein